MIKKDFPQTFAFDVVDQTEIKIAMFSKTLTNSLSSNTIKYRTFVALNPFNTSHNASSVYHNASMATFNEAHLISLGSSGIASILNTRIETFSSRRDRYSSYQRGKRPQKCILLQKTFSSTMHSVE